MEVSVVTEVKPLCPLFGTCGGCQYQDISYEEELARKETILKELLEKEAGLSEDLFELITPSPEVYYYRNRLDLTLRKRNSGERQMGFMLPGTQRLQEVTACPIARKEINDFLSVLKEEAVRKLPADYRTANLVVRVGDEGKVSWGGIGRRSLRMQEEDYFWTVVKGRKIFYALDTFFQANLSILGRIASRIESLIEWQKDTVFLDLYSGVGLFGIALADRAREVVMIEECRDSVALARFNVHYHGLMHTKILEGKVETHLPEVLTEFQGRPCAALIDPPRGGLASSAIEMLGQAKSLESLFYLSCSPESLARDLKHLARVGWQARKIMPFDFFPRTRHLETLVWFAPTVATGARKAKAACRTIGRHEAFASFIRSSGGALENKSKIRVAEKYDPVIFSECFGNTHPVEMEIGCGKGKFLVARASENPGTNFFGIDRVSKFMNIGKTRAQKRELPNVRFLRAEARAFLAGAIAPGSVSIFHIYFPDPWPKRRHQPRRVFTPEFLALLHARLVPGGWVEIATDDKDYFDAMKKTIAATAELWENVLETVNERILDGMNKTHYEIKWAAEGRTLYYAELRAA